MGHLLLIVLHVLAVLFAPLFLFLTIPAHVIYGAIDGAHALARKNRPTPATHVRCPDCRELVLKDARVCKHCRCQLVPAGERPQASGPSLGRPS